MKTNSTARVLAAIALFGAIGVGILRNRKAPSETVGPEATVFAMIQAARTGNVSRYLASYGAPALENLRQTIREQGETAFADEIRRSNATIQGIAAADPEITGDSAKIRVEYIYTDRTQVQRLSLIRYPKGWLIVGTEEEELARMPVPFGATVR